MKMGRTKDVNHHGHQGHQGFTKASEDPLRATLVSFASFVVHVVGPPTRASLRSKLIFIPEARRSTEVHRGFFAGSLMGELIFPCASAPLRLCVKSLVLPIFIQW